jgi:hypothetical protein
MREAFCQSRRMASFMPDIHALRAVRRDFLARVRVYAR